MHTGRIVFAQVMDYFPYRRFGTCVKRYAGDKKVRTFSCRDQLLCMIFAQLTGRESLRDIEACLRVLQPKLYHVGIRSNISRSTLADANEKRDWRIYADIAQILIDHCKILYVNEDIGLDLDATVYALDATTIDLCLSLFPWANFRRAKAGIIPGAKLGKRWAFIEDDLADHIRSLYACTRQALQVGHEEKKQCHSLNVVRRGGLDSPHQAASELDALLQQKLKPRRKNSTTS